MARLFGTDGVRGLANAEENDVFAPVPAEPAAAVEKCQVALRDHGPGAVQRRTGQNRFETGNEYFRPLIFLASQQHYTWPVGIVTLYGYMSSGSISVVLAGVVLSVVVVLAVYVFGQRYLIEGLTVGGLKG